MEQEYNKIDVNGYTIIEYSEKSIVIQGEKTKDIKELIKENGGKWNGNLKCGKGWIFSSKHREKVIKLLEDN